MGFAAANRIKDETGKTYGRLVVLAFKENREGQPHFKCKCACGKEVIVRGANLRSGNTKSCGCSRRRKSKRHGKMVLELFCGSIVLGKSNPKSKTTKWVTCCSFCGRSHSHSEHRIRNGKSPLCGCLQRTYTSWKKMIERCTYKKHPQFEDYGGRGIGIAEKWRRSFCEFLKDMGPRPNGKTLDRIDNDGDYSSRNCRWATPTQQAATRRKRQSARKILKS